MSLPGKYIVRQRDEKNSLHHNDEPFVFLFDTFRHSHQSKHTSRDMSSGKQFLDQCFSLLADDVNLALVSRLFKNRCQSARSVVSLSVIIFSWFPVTASHQPRSGV